MNSKIQAIIREHSGLSAAADALGENEDLYDAGMTSHATVNVMLALENEFDVEFPDRMLRRQVFGSVASMRQALEELLKEKEAGGA